MEIIGIKGCDKMFEIEAHNMVICTCQISDEDEKRIKEYVANHPEEFKCCDAKESILKAINILDDIEIYNNYVESDSYTEEICWSSFEDRSAEEILGE